MDLHLTDVAPQELLKLLMTASSSGEWIVVGALSVMLLVWGTRKWGGAIFPILKTDRGGVVLALLYAFVGDLSTSLLTGTPITLGTLGSAVAHACSAIGVWTGARRLANPKDKEVVDAKVTAEEVAPSEDG